MPRRGASIRHGFRSATNPVGRGPGSEGKRVGQDLQRDLPVQLRISVGIDLAHAALADQGQQSAPY